jgi:hypothetical protein
MECREPLLDDPALCRLQRERPLPGAISFALGCDPSFVLGLQTYSGSADIFVEHEDGCLAGVIVYAVREFFLGGEAVRVGYVSRLRLALRVKQPLRVLLRLNERLRIATERSGARLNFALITSDNSPARGLFVDSPCKNFPALTPLDDIVSVALKLRRISMPQEVRPASAADLPELISFLNEQGARRNWMPVLRRGDFERFENLFAFSAGDFLLCRRRGGIVAACAVWDQRRFRQLIVSDYSRHIRLLRPVHNALARLAGGPLLPERGGVVPQAYLAFLCGEAGSPDETSLLLRAACAAAAKRGIEYLVAGFSATDSRLSAALSFPHIRYASTRYCVSYREKFQSFGAPGHVELALL